MKAIVYHGNRDLRLETVEEPDPGTGQVKLRIDYCGICATDIEEYEYGPVFIADTPSPLTGKSIPLVTGHELTGTVVEAGKGVDDLMVGNRVVINGILTCEECRRCRQGETTQCRSITAVGFGIDGGLAEYMVWPASHVIPLPDEVTSQAAALAEPASVALHAVRKGRVQSGDRVAVLGVGTVGMMAMQVARAMGAQVYAVDRRPASLQLALDLGADAAINTEVDDPGGELAELTDGQGPDVVIDAAGGRETPKLSVEWARNGGRVVLVAIYTSKPEFDFNTIVSTETELIGSLSHQQRDVAEVVRLIASGSIKTTPLVSDVITLEEVVPVGFARMMARDKDIFRILVAPSGRPPV